MEFLMPRNPSHEHTALQLLSQRMTLPDDYLKQLNFMKKGLEGEMHFDSILEDVTTESLVLRDLLFEHNNEYFQIDTLLISAWSIYFFEIKNYSGDYYIKNDKWYNPANSLIKDPTHQLSRCETLFRQFLINNNQSQFTIKPLVVFPHPEFTLILASQISTIILPNQIPKLIRQLNNGRHLKLTQKEYDLSELLISCNVAKYPYTRFPEYNFNHLKKGVVCPNCHHWIALKTQRLLICDSCTYIETSLLAVYRIIEDFLILFPEQKLTTDIIFKWSGEVFSKKVIQRVLYKNFKIARNGSQTYYIRSL